MLWVKSFHIIAMVAWFAGIFYLPRLYVYHADTEDQVSIERFKIMERRLYRGIMWPSMIVTLFLGLWLLHYIPVYLKASWMHAKLGLVALVVVYHLYCGALRKQFALEKNRHSAKFYRILNEIPTLLLVAIVILVVVKP
jgi:putative membrane protein